MVGIYTEDGNEMGNAFVRNVVVCTTWDVCHVDTAITDAVILVRPEVHQRQLPDHPWQ